MWDLSEEDLDGMKCELEEELQIRGVQVVDLSVSAPVEFDHIEVSAMLLSDRLLPTIDGQTCDRRINLTMTGVIESASTGLPVLWGEIEYCVPRKHSFFSPVPEEYGDEISVRFGWEFNAETLEPDYASVWERKSVHYVSVLPSEVLSIAIRCFSNLLDGLLDESEDE